LFPIQQGAFRFSEGLMAGFTFVALHTGFGFASFDDIRLG
jgi:hypothetical protein